MVGDQIKLLREEKGWTQKKLSEKSGIDRSSISLIENNKHGISLTVYKLLLHAMGYDLKIIKKGEKR